MRLGVFAKTFAGSDPARVLGAARDAGFGCVQYNMACSGLPSLPDHVPPEALDAIAAAMREMGVAVPALSATWNMAHPDPAVRAAGLRSMEVLAEVAAALGIPVLTLCTGSRNVADQWAHHPDNAGPEAWTDMREGMMRSLEIAEHWDVRLGIEPELANVVSDAARARELLDSVGSRRLGVVLDAANLFEAAGEADRRDAVERAVGLLGPDVLLAHAKDRREDGAVAAPGQGAIDWPHYLGALRAAGFEGPLITHGLGEAEAPGVAAFLSRVLAEA